MEGGVLVSGQAFRAQFSAIAQACEQLSQEHRLRYATEGVYARMREVLHEARPLFQDWTIEICLLLEHGSVQRFNQLLSELSGISTRTLSTKLAQLQEFGFVDRAFFDENPPRVEYRLTGSGRRFLALLFPSLIHVADS